MENQNYPIKDPRGGSDPHLPHLGSQEHPFHLHPSHAFLSEAYPSLSTGCLPPVSLALSLAELPHLVAEVGPEVAIAESLWTEGPHLMTSALGVDIPVNAVKVQPVEETQKAADAAGSAVPLGKPTDATSSRPKAQPKMESLTGMEVWEILTTRRHFGAFQFVHLNVVDGTSHRPYDLHVVPRSQAGNEHYVFSPTSVLHVRDGCCVGLCTLAEWHREARLWRALQDIPSFRLFRLRKTFSCWRRTIRQGILHCRRKILQKQLLMAVPQFRDALIQLNRLIEELKQVHWLPQDASRTYTLLDFQNILGKQNHESRRMLAKLLKYQTFILHLVWEESYAAKRDLQLHVERLYIHQDRHSLHHQQAQLRSLQKELGQANHVLQRLGNMATLANQMIVHNLVTIISSEVKSFVINALKRRQPQQASFFQAELRFGSSGQLTLHPPVHLFQEALHSAVLSVGNSALRVFDSSRDSPDDSISGLSGTKEPCASLAPSLMLPKLNPLHEEEQSLGEQYYLMFRNQLEWQLSLKADTQEAERKQAKITQEALVEVLQMCEDYSWLVDIHLFTSQWSRARMEALRSCDHYGQQVLQVRSWQEKLLSVPAFYITSNNLLTVHFSHLLEKIVPVLSSIEEDMLILLVGELKQRSDSLISELNKAVEDLRMEPTDVSNYTLYASMVKRYQRMSNDFDQQMEQLRSLQETLHLQYRALNAEEAQLEKQLLHLWKHFKLLLKSAAEKLNDRLPFLSNTLDSTFHSLLQELKALLSKATSGPYLDPSQMATLMVSQLDSFCKHFYAVSAHLQELSWSSEMLRGEPLDLSFVEAAKIKLEARKGLWELLSVCAAQIQEWKLLMFKKFVVQRAQGRVSEWLQQAEELAQSIPASDTVLRNAQQLLEGFSQQLSVLANLNSPKIKPKQWRNILKAMDLLCTTERDLTVAVFLSKRLLEHQDEISKICREAKAEANMREAFQELRRHWERTQFCLIRFIMTEWGEDNPWKSVPISNIKQPVSSMPCDGSTFTIIGWEDLLTQTGDSVMTLSTMLLSPHVAEIRQEVEYWVQLLQELDELLGFWERYQQRWVFLSKMFYETGVNMQKPDLVERFCQVDLTYREMVQNVATDPHVLNIVQPVDMKRQGRFQGSSLLAVFMEGLSIMEGICNQLLHLLDSPRKEFPRLCFLSDGEVTKLLFLHPTPSLLLSTVRKCFRGVCWLKVNAGSTEMLHPKEMDINSSIALTNTQLRVWGVIGPLGEQVSFLQALEPSVDAVVWLIQLEQQLQCAMVQLTYQCTAVQESLEPLAKDKILEDVPSPRGQGSPTGLSRQVRGQKSKEADRLTSFWNLLLDFPLQCVLLAEEALWHREIQEAFLNPAPSKKISLRTRYTAKLKILCRMIQNGFAGFDGRFQDSYCTTVLQALILLAIKHNRQIDGLLNLKANLESSFEWHKLLKYRFSVGDQSGQSNLSMTQGDNELQKQYCFVDILDSQFPYGYEYLGPDQWIMVNTLSSDRAAVGILLALSSFRCAFVNGFSMSGKSKTVAHLGAALGQPVVTLQCSQNTAPVVILNMLLGALQTGAWLVLDAVDSLMQGTLSLLGQHLSDIHASLSAMQGFGWSKHASEELRCWGQISLAGNPVSPKFGYGCVIISSSCHISDVPENLRLATRPVSLTQPDYRLIAEVSLAALGFSESASLSCHLVTLFSLAKDSLCFPEFLTNGPSSWLVLLKKVIDVAGAYLYQLCKAWLNDKDNVIRGKLGKGACLSGTALRLEEKTESEGKDPVMGHHRCSHQASAVFHAVVEEQAVIKGVKSVLLSAIFDPRKASHFCTIFEEIFQAASCPSLYSQYTDEAELVILRTAVNEELQESGLHTDPIMLCNALSLYQSLKRDQTVLLVGHPGSGKTMCYRALSGALRKLAARVQQDVGSECRSSDMEQNSPNWVSVNTVLIFPNSLSHKEFWGSWNEGQDCWCDGAFTKELRDSESRGFSITSQAPNVKWIVLDGDPAAQPGWLDPFSTICNPEDPFLSLPTGEKIRPSERELKILVEVSNLENASPSVITRCSHVYHSGKDIWRAVWKAELQALYREQGLDEVTLRMWTRLSEDLFDSTLLFLTREVSVLPEDRQEKLSRGVVYGLQEVMSFIRILHAFLVHFGNGSTLTPQTYNNEVAAHTHCPAEPVVSTGPQELQMRNLFVVAYIWGFGGHLHPRFWPQYDAFAREALYHSRYRVEVPAGGLIFQHFINFNEGPQWEASTGICSTGKRSLPLSYPIIPQYEKHAFLLDLMLEARQPALVVGEKGSGKTTLCRSLMSRERPHRRLPASPCLTTADLRGILESLGCQKTKLDNMPVSVQKTGCLLFVDDLHSAPCGLDISGASMALETLRLSMSRGGVLTSDGLRFKLFRSGAFSYLATCSTPTKDHLSYGSITPRLSRLFSIFTLPDLSEEVLFSIHHPRLQPWLKEVQIMPHLKNVSACIISATLDLYHLVQEKFPRNMERPYLMFSPCDLQKVFQGMCLWGPQRCTRQPNSSTHMPISQSSFYLHPFTMATHGLLADLLSIVRLWMHECLRTFGDRLCSEEEKKLLISLIVQVSEVTFGEREPSQHSADKLGNEPSIVCSAPVMEKAHLKKSPRSSGKYRNKQGEEWISSSSETDHEDTQDNSKDFPGKEINFNSRVSCCVSEEELQSEKFSKSFENDNVSQGIKEEMMKDMKPKNLGPNFGPMSDDISDPSVLWPTPPKQTKPPDKSDWKRSFKLVAQCPQKSVLNPVIVTKQTPTLGLLPLDLLRGMEITIQDAVFSPELSEQAHSSAQQNFKYNAAYLERDPGVLFQQLRRIMKLRVGTQLTEPGISCHGYAMFGQRLHQLAHVLRAMLIPGGHGALFAKVKGTGRRTNVRLAAQLTGCRLLEVHAGNEAMLHQLLKEAATRSGLHGSNVVLLVHDDASQPIRDEILLVMANGSFPDLYSNKELKEMIKKINAKIKNSCNQLREEEGVAKFFRQVEQNMHVFLIMPLESSKMLGQTGNLLWGSIARATELCCCVEVYQPWSTQSLIEVAAHHLKQNIQVSDLGVQVDGATWLSSVPLIMAGIHQSALAYTETLLPPLHLYSPQTYAHLMENFIYLCKHLSDKIKDEAKKMTTVLSHLKDMTNEVDQYRENVLTIRTKLTKAQQLHSPLQHEVKTAWVLYDQARQVRLLEEEQLAGLEEAKRRAEQRVDDAFQQVSPLYHAAVQAVQSLSQSDVNEVRHYRQPPDGVMPVMDAICLLFGRPCGWESSVQLMCQPDFFQELACYDRSRVHGQLFEALQQMVERPGMQPEAVRGVSRACESLCLWVHAVYQHVCVQRHVAPQEALHAQLGTRLAECQTRLHLRQVQEESTHQLLRDTEKRLRASEEEGEELRERLHQSESWEQEGATAIRWLEPHIKAWKSVAERSEESAKTAAGDALILAAAITYLGPFGPDVRCELLEKWRELCCSGWINPTPEDPRRVPLSPPGPVSANAACFAPVPVARDVFLPLSRAVGVVHGVHPSSKPCLLIKLLLWGVWDHCARHWPLLADVQQRNKLSSADKGWTGGFSMKDCSAWNGRGYDIVVDATDPTLLDKIRQSAEKGSSVLVTHAEQAPPCPEFLHLLLRPSRSRASPLSSLLHTVHPKFHLVLSTPLPVQALQHEIHPSILAKVQVIDFSLGAAEVQDVLLMEIVQTRCPGLWKQRYLFLRDQQALLEKLQQIETSLLEHIHQSFSPVLQDPHLYPLMSTYQNAASGLQAELAEVTLEVERHDAMLATFHRAVRLAADLYRALQEVARLCPLYRFPLHDFLQVVKEAIILNKHLDGNSRGQLPAGTVVAAITDTLVRRVLEHYQPYLLQNHVTLLWLLVSVSHCQHNEGSSEAERVAFLHGLATEPSPEANEPKALTSPYPTCEPSWIPLHTHSKVLCLEKLPPFAGLLSSLQAYPERWREYLRFPSSTIMGPVPFSAFSHLSTLQRALLWKTLLPHCLAAVVDDLAACLLGQPAGASLTSAAPEVTSTILDKSKGTIILMLPGQKGQPYTHPLRWLNQAAQCLPDKKVNVQVVTFGGKCHKEAVLAVLDEAVQKGHWLVFNNCHLLDQWDEDVVYRITQLVSCTGQGNITGVKQEKNLSPSRDGNRLAQPGFRLWFICQAQAPFSIPVAVRMNATCLVCSSPRDLKGVLSYSLQQFASAARAASTSSEALLQCSILHSVLLQHQTYLGQGHHYSWIQEDLLVLLDAEVRFAGRLADPAAALEYIAVLVYGGQIADSVDLETVESLARVCVRPPPSSQWDSGPLSELFKISGCSGLAEQLNGLLAQVQGFPHHSDPTLLGFTSRLDVELVKEQSRSLDRLLQQLSGPWGHLPRSRMEGDDPPVSDLQHVRARLLTLRDMLGIKGSQRPVASSAVFLCPLQRFLEQEMDCLIEVVSSLLAGLTLSPQNTGPASPAPTLLGLSRMEKQAELLSAYLQEESICTYCLSAFFNPHGFLAALVREGIRDKHVDISQVFLHFQVLSAIGLPNSPPDSGAYLCGLELQGAQWDTQLGALQDTPSSKRCPFPILWVRPKSRAVKSCWSQDNPPLSVPSSLPLYHCPLYLEAGSPDTGMSLAEKNIITRVPLASELDPGLCAVRRVRLVSSLRHPESYMLSQWH
ncbi:dynein heavy chain domain-containing protein 1 isoform X2 [Brienomyrus brachyistius]|uniref:dynein heavy chain domain-containing protein 1 isoform X2 n=1 Tax=Brienomyrus brachyistius TaxID=42636 RepID=UPI0020B3A13D|nr:dynein heavy chain domain-containing protein 1 isoform X2 [Brienomyrus brachyistius]